MKKHIFGVCSAFAFAAVMLCAVAAAQNPSSEKTKEEKFGELLAAAEKGDAKAQCDLGVLFYQDEEFYPQAAYWLRKATDQKHASATAQWLLGVLYWGGQGLAEDKHEASRWFRKSATKGHAVAYMNLAHMYAKGIIVAKDEREVRRLYIKAADLGHAESQFQVGLSYFHGKGFAKDEAEALRWLRKAAEQGHAGAQFALGFLFYGKGTVVERDFRESVRWFRKAAEQNHAKAQTLLGIAYFSGDGVITDKREAYIWYSLAKANGDVDGDDNAAEYLRANNWREYLSKSEILSAEKEAAKRMEEFDINETLYKGLQAAKSLSCK